MENLKQRKHEVLKSYNCTDLKTKFKFLFKSQEFFQLWPCSFRHVQHLSITLSTVYFSPKWLNSISVFCSLYSRTTYLHCARCRLTYFCWKHTKSNQMDWQFEGEGRQENTKFSTLAPSLKQMMGTTANSLTWLHPYSPNSWIGRRNCRQSTHLNKSFFIQSRICKLASLHVWLLAGSRRSNIFCVLNFYFKYFWIVFLIKNRQTHPPPKIKNTKMII